MPTIAPASTHVRALSLGHGAVHALQLGQGIETPWRRLLTLNAYSDPSRGYRPLEDWLKETNDYYTQRDLDLRRVRFDDVTALVQQAGGRWTDDDGHKRNGLLSLYSKGQDVRDVHLAGYGRLATNAGAVAVLESGNRVYNATFRDSNLGAIRVHGAGCRIENVQAYRMNLPFWDVAYIYIAGRRSEPVDCVIRNVNLVSDGEKAQTKVYGKDDRAYEDWFVMPDDGASGVVGDGINMDGGGSTCGICVNEGTNIFLRFNAVGCPIPLKVNGYGIVNVHPDSTVDGRAVRASDIRVHGRPQIVGAVSVNQ